MRQLEASITTFNLGRVKVSLTRLAAVLSPADGKTPTNTGRAVGRGPQNFVAAATKFVVVAIIFVATCHEIHTS